MREIFKENGLTGEELEEFKSFLNEDLEGKYLIHKVVDHRRVFKETIDGKSYYVKWFKVRKKIDLVKMKIGVKKTIAKDSYLKALELERRSIKVIKPVYIAEALPYSVYVTRDVEELGFCKYENKSIGKKGSENISEELLDGYLELLEKKVYHYDYHLENFVFKDGVKYHLDLDDMKVLKKEKNDILHESLYNYLRFIDSRNLEKTGVLIKIKNNFGEESTDKIKRFKSFLKKRKKRLHDLIEWEKVLSN